MNDLEFSEKEIFQICEKMQIDRYNKESTSKARMIDEKTF